MQVFSKDSKDERMIANEVLEKRQRNLPVFLRKKDKNEPKTQVEFAEIKAEKTEKEKS